MRRIFPVTFLLLAAIRAACGQTAAFEVASVIPCKPGTPAPPGGGPPMVKWTFPGGRFNAQAATLKGLIEWSYGIIPEQFAGGPAWMDEDRYDIAAKAPGNAADREIKLMVRNLLAERFKLRIRADSRLMSILAISLGKGAPRLSPARENEEHGLRLERRMSADSKAGLYHVTATRFTLEELNETFAHQLGRVIVDRTGLKGEFDFTLDFGFDEERPNPLDPSNIIGAIRDQLGLAVKAEKGLAGFFTIESVERMPAAN